MLLKLLIPDDKQKVKDYIDRLPDKQYDVEIRLRRKKRTLDQNALYWAHLSCISQETGNSTEDLHEYFRQKFLGCEKHIVQVGNEDSVVVRRSTTKLDTKQMTEYMDKVWQFANDSLGIILPLPEDKYYEEFIEQ